MVRPKPTVTKPPFHPVKIGPGGIGGTVSPGLPQALYDDSPGVLERDLQVLSGKVGPLLLDGIWTAPDPPKAAGPYGIVLQQALIGVTLRDSFDSLANSFESAKRASEQTLRKVKTSRPLTFKRAKGA